MTRTVIYSRISSDPTGKAAGVKRQETDCRKLAADLGLEVVQVFTDNDVSATSRRPRPAWEAMLNLIESDGIDTLLCWHPDRLYRKPQDLERLLDLLEGGALPGMVRTVQSGDLDLATASGRMVARILVGVAAHEVEHGKARVTRAKQEAALEGRWGGGRRPFGFDPDGVTVRPDEAELIREAAERLLAGESLRAIALDWTQRELPTAGGGLRWRDSALRGILTRPRVAGLRQHRGDVIGPAEWPAILTEEKWRSVCATLADPARRRHGGRPGPDGKTRSYWLNGVAVCGRCGAKLTSRGGAYVCPGVNEGSCGRLAVNADRIETYLSSLLYGRLDASDLPDLNPAPEGTRRAALIAELDEVHRRLVEIGEAIGAGAISLTVAMSAERTALEAQTRLEGELRRLTIAEVAGALPAGLTEETWSQAMPEELAQVARVMFRRVVVHPAAHKGQRFTPERLTVEWADKRANEDAA